MPHTKSQKLISWIELDRCETADDIARLLQKHSIFSKECPLVKATGWVISGVSRWRTVPKWERMLLTDAECAFLYKFKAAQYPFLESK